MLIGILSDTHDKIGIARAAIKMLQSRGAEYFIHCGDVGGEAVLDQLAGLAAAFVWGNNDWDRDTLGRSAVRLGLRCCDTFGDLELGGKKFAVIHGDDTRLKRRLLEEQRHDYLLQGHTHVPRDERIGKVRVINPGALHRATPKTVAILDTESQALEFIEIAGSVS